MKLINYKLENGDVTIGNVRLTTRESDGALLLGIDETYWLEDNDLYIYGFCKELPLLEFNSVLIGGLGMGLIPYWIQQNKNVETLEIVEINKNVIDCVLSQGYLQNVVVSIDDALYIDNFQKYDLIIMDLWWILPEDFESQKQQIISNYSNNLNENGKIYFPASQEIIRYDEII